jgi:hypothetical protein
MRAQLERDFERFKRELPDDLAGHVRGTYRIDLTARYLGHTLPHPIGKASGQLSLNLEQVETDAAAGVAFVVLKTVIAQDPAGARSMEAWAIHEARMKVERRKSAGGQVGWTVTWKGRGWDRSFDEYLSLVRAAGDMTRAGKMVVVPSVKYHLPRLDEPFRWEEYHYTTERLSAAWGGEGLILEKDFSPTLAGDPLADERGQILRWLREVPSQIRRAAGSRPVVLGLKVMNARFDDAFQLAMLQAGRGADGLTVFNRLWDADERIAYGGVDLSDRNLRVLVSAHSEGLDLPPLSGTGNVCSGRLILDYARVGCESVQLHTFFQLPLSQYPATHGSRPQRALHALLFHPGDGLIAALLDLEEAGLLERRGGALHFLDIARFGQSKSKHENTKETENTKAG